MKYSTQILTITCNKNYLTRSGIMIGMSRPLLPPHKFSSLCSTYSLPRTSRALWQIHLCFQPKDATTIDWDTFAARVAIIFHLLPHQAVADPRVKDLVNTASCTMINNCQLASTLVIYLFTLIHFSLRGKVCNVKQLTGFNTIQVSSII